MAPAPGSLREPHWDWAPYRKAELRGLPFRTRHRSWERELQRVEEWALKRHRLAQQRKEQRPPWRLRDLRRVLARGVVLDGGEIQRRDLHLRQELASLLARHARDLAGALRELDRLITLWGPDAPAEASGDMFAHHRSEDEWDTEGGSGEGAASSPAKPAQQGQPQQGQGGEHVGSAVSTPSAPRATGAMARTSGPGEDLTRPLGNRGKSSLRTESGETGEHGSLAAQGLGPPASAPPGARAEDPGTPNGRDERTVGLGEALARAQPRRARSLDAHTQAGSAEPRRPGHPSPAQEAGTPADVVHGPGGAGGRDQEAAPTATSPGDESDIDPADALTDEAADEEQTVAPSSPHAAPGRRRSGRRGPCVAPVRSLVAGSPSACDDARALMLSLGPNRRTEARRAAAALNRIVSGWVTAAGADELQPVVEPRRLVRELVQRTVRLERCFPERQERPQVLILGDVSGSCSAACTETWAAALAVAAAWPDIVVAAQNSNADLRRTWPDDGPERRAVVGRGAWGDALRRASIEGDTQPWGALVARPPAALAGVLALGDSHGTMVYSALGALAPVVWLDSDQASHLREPVPCTREWWQRDRNALFPSRRVHRFIGVNNARSMRLALERISR